jgi:hypothetical protein
MDGGKDGFELFEKLSGKRIADDLFASQAENRSSSVCKSG